LANRIFLSPPFQSGDEPEAVSRVLASNWIAPLGPEVDAFELEFAQVVGGAHAVALSSGTAGLHLALIEAGIGSGDEVVVSDLTFAASAFAVRYVGATPVFLDSDMTHWNLDAGIFEEFLAARARAGRLPKALLLVHLYGQAADNDRIRVACERHGVILIEDAAEALGASYRGRSPGIDGRCGVFSFNGNKIITTSGGGMIVCASAERAQRFRKLATQAREPAPHYEHAEIGFNYRLSNILAAVGRSQLATLAQRVEARRRIFSTYRAHLLNLPGLSFAAEADWGTHSRWLTCVTIDPSVAGVDREQIRLALETENIESRPLWKPMHLQPVFAGAEFHGPGVTDRLFAQGLCLPSGTAMSEADLGRVSSAIRRVFAAAA
jgi:dTDP-4-amino-4,6-dideoxygalactose transaminase